VRNSWAISTQDKRHCKKTSFSNFLQQNSSSEVNDSYYNPAFRLPTGGKVNEDDSEERRSMNHGMGCCRVLDDRQKALRQ
jgi:hypothetical protein